jgi:two-component system response regulator DesR
VLEALRDVKVVNPEGDSFRLLDEVGVIAGVSGGSFTALAYGLYGDELFGQYEQRFLKRDVEGELLGRLVVIVTTFARSGYLRRALDAGVAGYVLKDAPIEQLVDTLRRVHSGQRVIAPELAVAAWDGDDPLTDRERDVLRSAADGSPNAEIAARLHLAEGTVRNYLSSAIAKLGARNRTEAAATARERGWL